MSENEIFCPNCYRFIGYSAQCANCHWQRLATTSIGQPRWESRIYDEDHLAESTLFLTQLAAAPGLLIVPTECGDVAALDIDSGLVKWKRALHPDRKLRAQAVLPWKNLLLIGTQNLAERPSYNRSLVALHADTGEVAWLWQTVADNLSVPVVEQDTAFFTSSEPALYALDLTRRQLRWSSPTVTWSPEPPAVAVASPTDQSEGIIVVPSRGPHVAAYRISDGHPQWTFTAEDTENELLHHRPVLAPGTAAAAPAPGMAAGTAYLSGWGKRLYAVDLATGALRWRFQAKRGITCPPALAGNKVLVAVKDVRSTSEGDKPIYGLYALDSQSGEVIWKFQVDHHIYTLPCVAEQVVMFGANDKRFHALDLETGCEVWQFTADDKLTASSVLEGSRVFTAQSDARVFCLQWKEDLPAPQDPDALLAQGRPLDAAAALALSGRYVEGAHLYAGNGEPLHAAALFLEAGQPREAAEMYVQLQAYEQALSLYREAGDRSGEAGTLTLLGNHAEAAAIYEEIGDLSHAVQSYVEAGRAGYAAIMMWKKGRRVEAAELFQLINQDDQAAEVLVEEKNYTRAAKIYLRINKPDVAAGVLAQGGLLEQAAAINEQIGQLRLAAEQYAQAGNADQVMRLYEALQDWGHVADLAEKNGAPLRAANALVQLGQRERAAQFYRQAGRLDAALEQYEALGKWEKVAALADEMLLWQRKAVALSNMGMMTQAGEAYEQAARELQTRSPDDIEPIAALYEAAAQCYAEDDDWLRQGACIDQVCRLRNWPYLKAHLDASDFFQGETSLVTLVIQNVGYSPAHNIQVRGVSNKFHVDETESQVSVRMLGVQMERHLRLILQPRSDVLGQVLLRVELLYQDYAGKDHKANFEQGVKVLGRDEKVSAVEMQPRTPVSDIKVNEDIIRLTRGLVDLFNDEELQDLCYVYLQVEYENLRGETKGSRARDLVLLMRRHGRLAELKEVLRQLRPNGAW